MEISSSSSPENTLPMIPNDVVLEILSRAPAKSLLRFQWACKYWFESIRDPKFVKMHLLHHSTTTTHEDDDEYQFLNNTSLLIQSKKITDQLRICDPQVIYSMRCMDVFNQSLKKIKMDFYNLVVPMSYGDDYQYHEIWGSCNGLLYLYLLHSGRTLVYGYFLWNPCTRQLKKLPEPNIRYPNNKYFMVHGFGYDHTIDDYKVIRMVYYHSVCPFSNLNNSRVTGVYTLGSNSWSTKFESIPLIAKGKDSRGLGLFFKGAIHWIMRSPKQHGYLVKIMYFDIAKDEHGEIQLPANYYADEILPANYYDDGVSFLVSDLDLSVLNGCLCMSQFNGNMKMNVWMMKNYSVKDSWTKLFTINVEQLVEDISHDEFIFELYDLKLLKYRKDGGILMVLNGKYYIVMHDPTNKTKKNLVSFVHKISQFGDLFVEATYIETLVSLNSHFTLSFAGSRTTILHKHKIEEKMEEEKQDRNPKKIKNRIRRKYVIH